MEVKIHPCDSVQSDTSDITNNSGIIQTNVQIHSDSNLAETIIPVQTEVKIHPCDSVQSDTSDITNKVIISVQMEVKIHPSDSVQSDTSDIINNSGIVMSKFILIAS